MRRKEWEARLLAAALNGGLRQPAGRAGNSGERWVQPGALLKDMGINVD